MASLVTTLAQVLVMIFATYVLVAGGVGALLARARGGSAVGGFLRGLVLMPIGWIWVWFWTRHSRSERALSDLGRDGIEPASRCLPPDGPSVPAAIDDPSDSSGAGGHVF